MGAIVESLECVPADWLIPRNAAAGSTQRRKIAVGRGKAADRIDNDSYCDAGLRPLRQRPQKPITNLAGVKNERFYVNAVARCADGGEFRFVKNLAVRENFDRQGVMKRGVRDCAKET